ncbi:DUF2723 domain-containing protein, partial [Candidatus Sumerlaeota bacterium]|nr:DUF2723 domain-containing protein [Candidatus Sumerlaeota bacterium]
MTQPAKSWSSAAVFFIPGGLILSLYLWTGAPGAWWGDGLELAAAAKTLGVPHPTGYPLYMVLGHLTIRAAPFLDAGRALTIFSSLLCAGSAAMLGALLFVRLKERDSARESDADRRPLSIALAASGAALALAFTRTLWEHATFA